ncbi:17327_t:CDS:2 [Funneliformis caledonium]|uniref:17327_t:CDS:1 n=1 Tax=Funneliformis caledonium TaxID=1117310 RepID=A0A9N9CKG2_9GLOM|nr:17327_t:CDS:2 [Funneliformis caledonium]
MLKIISEYLHGLAAYWFEENDNTINRWNEDDNATASFLNILRQGPYEKVDFYAEKFKKLLKKVDSSSVLLDKYTVRLFFNGLRKNIVPFIAFSYPKNVDEAIEAAK